MTGQSHILVYWGKTDPDDPDEREYEILHHPTCGEEVRDRESMHSWLVYTCDVDAEFSSNGWYCIDTQYVRDRKNWIEVEELPLGYYEIKAWIHQHYFGDWSSGVTILREITSDCT